MTSLSETHGQPLGFTRKYLADGWPAPRCYFLSSTTEACSASTIFWKKPRAAAYSDTGRVTAAVSSRRATTSSSPSTSTVIA